MSPSSALTRALKALRTALARSGARHVLIGGMAVIARGVRRHTDDLDATVWAEDVSLDDLLAALANQRIVPRIADARAFAASHQVLLLVHEPTGVTMEVSMGWLPFELEAIETAEVLTIAGARIPVARAEDLVVLKTVAWRDRDRADVERLLALHGATMDMHRVRSVVSQFAQALGEPERQAELEAIIKRVVTRRPSRTKPARSRRRTR